MQSSRIMRGRWLATALLLPVVISAPLPSATPSAQTQTQIPGITSASALRSTSSMPTATAIATATPTLIIELAAPQPTITEATAPPSDSAAVIDTDTDDISPLLFGPANVNAITGGPTSTSAWAWAAPAGFSNMATFAVSAYAAGASNLAVLAGSPASPASSSSSSAEVGSQSVDRWDASQNSLQVSYPKGSMNPGNKPQGGAEFYAQPIDISQATNASLQYSVYFPPDFDFVKGGKLPGLYGGHKGCSGGNAAEDCFSTRLMWRTGGLGELYLYAPKDKQTPALCQTKPKSLCDSQYGLSIGRGAWKFALGDWTTVRQDVWLNTPGQNDGGFNIWVNGQLVLSASDVRYRENSDACLQGQAEGDSDSALDALSLNNTTAGMAVDEDWESADVDDESAITATATSTWTSTTLVTVTSTLSAGAGSIPTSLARRQNGADAGAVASDSGNITASEAALTQALTQAITAPVTMTISAASTSTCLPSPTSTALFAQSAGPTPTSTSDSDATEQADQSSEQYKSLPTINDPQPFIMAAPPVQAESSNRLPALPVPADANSSCAIGFMGLFFSTFFGGHTSDWASPSDQYTYFRGFQMWINN